MAYYREFASSSMREELTPEQVAALWASYAEVNVPGAVLSERAARRKAALEDELIDNYFPLVCQTAERLAKNLPDFIDVEDLISYGSLGLIDAIRKFSPDREVKFSTYCVPRIRGAVLDELRRLDWVPRQVRIQEAQHKRVRDDLEARLGRHPNEMELAAALNMTEGEYDDFQRELRVKTMVSLERKRDEDDEHDQGQIDLLPDKRAGDPLNELARKELKEVALRGLSDDEKKVLVLYYEEELKLKEIGEIIGKSESRVCQIHQKMLEFLRAKFEDSSFAHDSANR